MTGAEFLTMRESLGVTAQWVADELGISLRTVQFWEAERSAVPDRAGILLATIDSAIEATVDDVLRSARDTDGQVYSLARYKDEASISATYPRLVNHAAKTQGVMLARAARALVAVGIQPQIRWGD